MSYWIEGLFEQWWSKKSFYCKERDIFVPVWAIKNLKYFDDSHTDYEKIIYKRVEIIERFVLKQAEDLENYIKGKHNMGQKEFWYTKRFLEALNIPLTDLIKDKEDKLIQEILAPPTGLP